MKNRRYEYRKTSTITQLRDVRLRLTQLYCLWKLPNHQMVKCNKPMFLYHPWIKSTWFFMAVVWLVSNVLEQQGYEIGNISYRILNLLLFIPKFC